MKPARQRRARRRAPETPLDAEQQRRALVRVSLIALWVWPSFHLLDIFMILALYPEASYPRYPALRLANEAVVALTMVLARRRQTSPRVLRLVHGFSYWMMGASISIMALQFGGVHSVYMHGISIVILARSSLVPARWQWALAESALTVVSFPVVMAIAAALGPGAATALPSGAPLALFASNYVFVVGSMIVGAIASHLAWGAQRQVYRARKIGRYRLEAPIAKGGMGEMWLAWDEVLRRNVALKLRRTDGPDDASMAARFEREAHAASQLNDPHTIRIFDYGATDDGIQFMAMEYLAGADLGAIVNGHGAMPAARAVHLIRQACQSLAEAHAAGIVHRDVKPQNLFVTQVGEEYDFLKLLDFGIARLSEADGGLTRTGVIPGTPAYMAPEMWRGESGDPRSDIYSVGATLCFLVLGAPPFGEGVVRSLQDDGRSAIALGLRSAVPADLAAIVMRCLEIEPDRRFQTATELQAALAACAAVAPVGSWNPEDARQFWQVTHAAAISRWAATTSA